jgi:hypothetical protein
MGPSKRQKQSNEASQVAKTFRLIPAEIGIENDGHREPAQPQVAEETPGTSELYSLCQKILPPNNFERLEDKYGGEDVINNLGLKLNPNETWSAGSIGIFADIVGSLFDHISKRAIIQ